MADDNPYSPPPPDRVSLDKGPPPHAPPPPSYGPPPKYGQPPQYGQPLIYGQPPQYGQPPGYPLPGYGPPQGFGYPPAPSDYGGPQTPQSMMRTAAGRARAAVVLLWLLAGSWLLAVVSGLVVLDVRAKQDDGGFAAVQDAADNADGVMGITLLLLLGLGTATWALLALWSSWTARAARAAGRGGEVSSTHTAWWGIAVPIAAVGLPVVAHVQAGRFTDSACHRRTGRVPTGLVVSWVVGSLALVTFFVGMGLTGEVTAESDELDAAGAALVLAGLVGAAAAAVGAVAMRQLAEAAEQASRA